MSIYTTYTMRVDSPEAIARAEEKQADCYERFNHVEVVPYGINQVQIKCWN